MDHQDTSSWPQWTGFITAGNVFIATLAARDLSALKAWRIEFWYSAAISAIMAIAIGLFVTIGCKRLERARLIRHTKHRDYGTVSEEREYIQKVATDLSEVMQRPFAPRDRNWKRKKSFSATKRAEKGNAATDDDDQ